ncbi:Uncharacterised protein [Bordetella pertussis]|nr:Uncharacterised protein [Bordetella pertussis]
MTSGDTPPATNREKSESSVNARTSSKVGSGKSVSASAAGPGAWTGAASARSGVSSGRSATAGAPANGVSASDACATPAAGSAAVSACWRASLLRRDQRPMKPAGSWLMARLRRASWWC